MQDLEELKKNLDRDDHLGIADSLLLIDRLQAAEKENISYKYENDNLNASVEHQRLSGLERAKENVIMANEIKALREQKPVAWRKEHKVSIGVEYSYTSTFSHVEDWAAAGITLTPLYAAPVAKSRDSAEPVFWYRPTSSGGYEGPIHNSSIDAVRKDSGVWKPLFDHSAHPLATVEAKQSEPLAWKSKTEAYTPYITDSRYQKLAPAFRQWYEPIVEAKQAAPNGWKLVPIEMDDKMQAAAMKVLDDSIGNYASSRARDCYAAMLAAAPQPESAAPEQDDWKSKAAAWLRAKADAQEKKNIAYPEHAKCYPSWVKRVRDLRWDAEELDGVMGSYGAPADEDLSEDDADSDSILAEIAGTTNRTATWKQFSEYLQRLARSAIYCKQSPAPKAKE